MISHTDNLSVLKHNYFIRVYYGCNSLCYYYFSRVFQTRCKRLSDFSLCGCVNGTCTVVKYKNFRLFQKCNTQSLLLSAGNIDTALSELHIIAVRKCVYKSVSLCGVRSGTNFFHCGIFVTPTKIFFDTSAEQYIFLKYHADAVTQIFKTVILNIHAVNKHFTVCNVIKTRYKLYKRRFTRACCADYTDNFSRLCGK